MDYKAGRNEELIIAYVSSPAIQLRGKVCARDGPLRQRRREQSEVLQGETAQDRVPRKMS